MLLFFFVIAPIIELLFAITLARQIGWVPLVIWMAVAFVAGVVVMRSVGLWAWRAVRLALSERRVPATEAANGLLLLFAGLLILLPGLLSDVGGVLLLLPPVRAAIRRRVREKWWPARIARATITVVDERSARPRPQQTLEP